MVSKDDNTGGRWGKHGADEMVAKSVGKNLFGIPRTRYEDNIKMDLKKQTVKIWAIIHMTLNMINNILSHYLFNRTVSSSGYVVLDGGTINE
jgi:hypothetical protein